MISRSASPERRTVTANSRWSVSSSVSRSRPVIPITPLRGVRISWLMLARNWDFSREPSTASSRAAFNDERDSCSSPVRSSTSAMA